MSTASIAGKGAEGVRGETHSLHRKIDWTGAFWVASGVPALVLFSIGGIAATVGKASWLVWTISIIFGFIQSFTYAEIAGLYPGKSGGASIYGAVAWVRYAKFLAPTSVWCNWFAWSPVLAIGSGLGAGYILSLFFAPDAAINTWQVTLFDLRINATFFIGLVLMLACFLIQHGGILRSARATMIMGVVALLPLMLIGIVPLLTGDMPRENFFPLVPLGHDEAGNPIDGAWDKAGWILFIGGLFIAAWSTYGFETAVCYTREFKDPKSDTFKAIFYSGLVCLAVFILVPLSFQGALGLQGMLAPDIYSGMGVGKAMANMLGGGPAIELIVAMLLILALMLTIMTAMAGSSRTLYQASLDGWLPRYLSHVNEQGAPTRAMWTDLCFNLILLMMSDYLFILAASNVGYIIFNFLNLNAGWIHRMDRPNWERPYRAPTLLITIGGILAFVNAGLMGIGADVWGAHTLWTGLTFAALIIPVFLFRHYIQDKGVFPKDMAEDMHLGREEGVAKRAGMLPYLALAAGVAIVLIGHYWASS
jgi:amino acid transporter